MGGGGRRGPLDSKSCNGKGEPTFGAAPGSLRLPALGRPAEAAVFNANMQKPVDTKRSEEGGLVVDVMVPGCVGGGSRAHWGLPWSNQGRPALAKTKLQRPDVVGVDILPAVRQPANFQAWHRAVEGGRRT